MTDRSSQATACPPLATYSKEFLKKAADELAALPKDSALGVIVVDAGKTRDACRAMK